MGSSDSEVSELLQSEGWCLAIDELVVCSLNGVAVFPTRPLEVLSLRQIDTQEKKSMLVVTKLPCSLKICYSMSTRRTLVKEEIMALQVSDKMGVEVAWYEEGWCSISHSAQCWRVDSSRWSSCRPTGRPLSARQWLEASRARDWSGSILGALGDCEP